MGPDVGGGGQFELVRERQHSDIVDERFGVVKRMNAYQRDPVAFRAFWRRARLSNPVPSKNPVTSDAPTMTTKSAAGIFSLVFSLTTQ